MGAGSWRGSPPTHARRGPPLQSGSCFIGPNACPLPAAANRQHTYDRELGGVLGEAPTVWREAGAAVLVGLKRYTAQMVERSESSDSTSRMIESPDERSALAAEAQRLYTNVDYTTVAQFTRSRIWH